MKHEVGGLQTKWTESHIHTHTHTHEHAHVCEPRKTKKCERATSGGSVVKSPPADAGDTGLIPVPLRSHRPRSS